MFRKVSVGMCLFLALAFSSNLASSGSVPPEGTLKSVSLFDLPENITEAEFVSALRELNQAVHSIGHLDAGYSLWRVREAQVEDTPSIGNDYILIGSWASQAVYDEIHGSAVYQAAGERLSPIFDSLGETRQYFRYEELSVGGPGEG